jgi:DNA-directed DNA polymerase III PolC
MARQPSGPSGFVHLHVRSAHSHLFGASRLEELIQAAQALGYHDLALTDRDGLYGSIAFYQKAREAGLKPILGVELIQPVGAARGGTAEGRDRATPNTPAQHRASMPPLGADAKPRARAVCLARNLAGYRTTCRLVTARHLKPGFDLAEALAADHEDIYVLVPDAALLARLAGGLPEGRLLALLAEVGDRSTRLYGDGLVRAASKRGVPLVAGGAVAFHAPGRYAAHRTLRAIATLTTVADVPRRELAHPKAWLKGPEEMAALFRRHPEAAANAVRVAADCNLELALGRPIFPKAALPEGETPYSHLAKLAFAGLHERYRPLRPEAVRRLEHELEVIVRLGFADYFLIMHEIVSWARAGGTPCVARGSAAGSLVAYALGISGVDPLAYGLLFERFLNLERADCPDIDLDVCWRSRDALIDHIYQAYGNDRVAMIATHQTFQARSAFREAAKAHGLAPAEVDRLSRVLPYAPAARIRDAVLSFPECRDFPVNRPDVARVLEVAALLDGLPRHTSVHVGGLVIADRRLTDYVPLEVAAKGIVITQYEAEAVEALGLVKMDILAQRSLSILATAAREIEKNHGLRLDPMAIEDGDPGAAALLSRGDTFGCFQIESPGMRGLLRMMEAKGRRDVILGLSLIRPGPASSGMKEHFVRRRRGIEEPEYLHPALKEVLGDTYGVMLYQEDVIRVARAAAGFSLAEGDRLRKELSNGAPPSKLAECRTRFVRGAVARGASRTDAETLWDRVAQFAAYSYCKAHAATYGEIAYRAVYLRARWPAEFAAAVLANQAGYYERRTYVEDARRHGVPILGPDVNASGVEPSSERVERAARRFEPAAEAAGDIPGQGPRTVALRIGLMDICELGQRTMRQIVEERRERGRYRSVADLLARVRLSRQEAENLALSGALDALAANRPQALWQVHAALAGGVRPRQGGLLAEPADAGGPAAPPLEDYSPLQKLRLEEAVLGGITPSAGPMEIYYNISDCGFRISDFVRTCDLARHAGRQATVLGLLFAERRARTKTGEFMKFLSLEDPWGVVEAVLLPEAYQRLGGRVRTRGPYRVTGTVEAHYGALSLIVQDLAPLAPGANAMGPEAQGLQALGLEPLGLGPRP